MHSIIAIVLCSLSALFDIIGLAIPYWYHGSYLGVSESLGLWKACAGGTCADIPNTPGVFNTTRALEILGMLLLLASLVTVLLKQFVMKDKTFLTKVGGACALLGGILMIIGTIVFATDSDVKLLASLSNMKLHAGFALCIIAGVLALPAGIVMFLLKD